MRSTLQNTFAEIGAQIKELRLSFGGRGISQGDLARHLGTKANTISRWENGIYIPSTADLVKLARFFGVPIARLFPEPAYVPVPKELSLAIEGLGKDDLKEVIAYARFRRAQLRIKTDSDAPSGLKSIS